jgi:hypothetical protein
MGVTPEFRDMTKKEEEAVGGGKPQLLETRQWLELGAVAVTTGIALVGFRASIIAATAALGRMAGITALAPAAAVTATGAVAGTTVAASTTSAAIARTVATRVAAPLAALSMVGVGARPDPTTIGSLSPAQWAKMRNTPEYAAERQKYEEEQNAKPGFLGIKVRDPDLNRDQARLLKVLEQIEKNTAKAADTPKLSQPSAQ